MKKLLLLVLLLFGFISTSYAEYELKTFKNAKLDTTTYFFNGSVVKKDLYDFLLNLSDVKKLTKKNFNNKTYYVYEGQIISKQTYLSLSRNSREEEDLNLFLKLASKNQNIVSDFLYYSNGKLKSETRSLKGKLHGQQTWWYKNGDIKKVKYYKNGKEWIARDPEKEEEERIAKEEKVEEKRIADEKKVEEERIADEKKVEEERIADEKKKKKAEEKRITAAINKEEKRIEIYIKKLKGLSTKLKDLELDSLKVEVEQLISEVKVNTSSDLTVLKSLTKTLREMDSSVELKIKTEESKQRILSLKDYPGFRDLKPGLHYDELTEFCPLRKNAWVKCYGIDNIKFYGKFINDVLYELILDMGPIVNTEGFLSVFGENDSNIFIKMRNTMDKNYSRDYGYSERDRQLFNESEKSRLYRVYSKGQVVLEISRKEKDWSSDLWLYIHYLDPSKAERFLNENRPVRASEDDF